MNPVSTPIVPDPTSESSSPLDEMPSWLITGSSRGIGFELVRQLVADPANIVVATARNPDSATALQALTGSANGTLHIVKLDVASEQSIRDSLKPISELLGNTGLDYLYNNAAITEGNDSAFNFSYDGLLQTLQSNVAAPALLGQLYLPLLEKGSRKVIVNITSGLSSFGRDFGAKNATYTVSKTALNMLTYKQAKSRLDIIAFTIDPGWVKTEMGGAGAVMEVQESAARLIKLVTSATTEHFGGLFNNVGEPIVW